MTLLNIRQLYSHKHFGLFYKIVIELQDKGFNYRGNEYLWADIKRVARYDSFYHTLFFYQYGYPLSIIYLKNGKKIFLQGRIFQEEGQESGINFWHPTEAYKKLVSFLETKINENV